MLFYVMLARVPRDTRTRRARTPRPGGRRSRRRRHTSHPVGRRPHQNPRLPLWLRAKIKMLIAF